MGSGSHDGIWLAAVRDAFLTQSCILLKYKHSPKKAHSFIFLV